MWVLFICPRERTLIQRKSAEMHYKSAESRGKNMANETTNNVTETTETTVVEETTTETTPTVEELSAQIAQLTADRDKYKSANDKLSKESADYKRQLRARQTAEEQQAEEQAEAQRIRDEQFEEMKARLNRSEAEKAYKAVTDEKMVESLIDAVSDADHSAIASILEKYANAKVKEAQAEWMKSRPRVNMGGEGGITKEQFDAMSMAEKSKLYRENKAEYDRLNN